MDGIKIDYVLIEQYCSQLETIKTKFKDNLDNYIRSANKVVNDGSWQGLQTSNYKEKIKSLYDNSEEVFTALADAINYMKEKSNAYQGLEKSMISSVQSFGSGNVSNMVNKRNSSTINRSIMNG